MRKWQRIDVRELSRHVHRRPYAALVLSGQYEEAGDLGRFRVQAGDVILHDRFEGHLNRFSKSGAVIRNVVLPVDQGFRAGISKVADPDTIVRVAEKSEEEAATLLIACTSQRERGCADWPDELANALTLHPCLSLSSWSEATGVAPWTLSRGFTQVFGITPCAFRARARTRLAWKAITTSDEPLVRIAASLGFADQSHMTRSVTWMTGKGPKAWRYCCK